MYENRFLWSDNWWIEDNKAYFCAGEVGALFCVDFDTHKGKMIAHIPECNLINYRLYSYCKKYKNVVFCLPHKGKSVWCFDLLTSSWEEIKINNNKQVIACLTNSYGNDNERLWLVEIDSRKIIQLNLETKIVEKEYQIPEFGKSSIGECICVKNVLYCTAGDNVYSVDLNTDNIVIYNLPKVKADLYTICYDGTNFWLSGCYKEIYVWNPQNGIVKVIDKFPKKFGIYNFKRNDLSILDCDTFYSGVVSFFIDSISLGKYVWYVPFQSNKIIYIDKESYDMYVLEIESEEEDRKSLQNHLINHKYLVNYIRENRYIGLFSLKNREIFEIDTKKLSTDSKKYMLSSETLQILIKGFYDEQKILYETDGINCLRFFSIVNKVNKYEKKIMQNIGKCVYEIMS